MKINVSKSNEESSLDRLMNAIRENMRYVKLSEKNDPVEIAIKITYPESTLQHAFKCEFDDNRTE